MCGIWYLLGIDNDSLSRCDSSFTRIKHRGPDALRIQYDSRLKNTFIGFVRLTIVDSVYGMQPMILHKYPNIILLCNGELYNCKRLREQYKFEYETFCDVECIIQLYAKFGIKRAVQELDGVFAFVLIDMEKQKLYAGRDPYGVRPLFRLTNPTEGILGFSSEGKGLVNLIDVKNPSGYTMEQFPPGTYAQYDITDAKPFCEEEFRYYHIGAKPKFETLVPYSSLKTDHVHENIRKLLTSAVKKRLMAERRIGCMLSGGLDSSLIAALLVKAAKEANLPYQIQSFSVGMGSSPDVIAARKVAKHINTDHHEVCFTPEDVANVIDKVIYHLETCDITTVRASIGMYLISDYIQKNTDTRVVFSGEGADELAQGYIYFRDAPDSKAGHKESLRLLNNIYLYDGLRADRTTAAHGLELRVPFLDLQLTEYYLSLTAKSRQPQDGVEKHLLRSAFAGTDLIPDEILWRHKEAFSDGVASQKKSLFEVIQEIVEPKIPDDALSFAKSQYPHLTPVTKEALYYRKVFEKHYPDQAKRLTPYYWMPMWSNVSDPSARFLKHYAAPQD